ncbi:hypothetical protein [Bacillus sp. CDB3]|uniref:hypothetical protein n=1 Tax=Bacillus sp. CDB3 TaxID=360310 RepID=UPI0009D87C8C|nr:hypothetical protein [Bacillus sp. CDB3]OQR53394.1 hypothetical protein CDB3_30230 [Bacillus sp. CDB3]
MLKQKMMKVALCGALGVGVVGSMEALKPSQASAAVSSQGIIDTITGNIKSTKALIEASNDIYKTLQGTGFSDRAKRQNNMYNYLAQMTQQTPGYNLVLVKQSLSHAFVDPNTRANLNLGTDPSYHQVNNIKINGGTYTLHAFKKAAVFRSTDPQYMKYLGVNPSGTWYQKLGTHLQSFMTHGLPNGNDMVIIQGAEQNPQFNGLNETYIGQR